MRCARAAVCTTGIVLYFWNMVSLYRQAGLELIDIHLPLSPKSWDDRLGLRCMNSSHASSKHAEDRYEELTAWDCTTRHKVQGLNPRHRLCCLSWTFKVGHFGTKTVLRYSCFLTSLCCYTERQMLFPKPQALALTCSLKWGTWTKISKCHNRTTALHQIPSAQWACQPLL